MFSSNLYSSPINGGLNLTPLLDDIMYTFPVLLRSCLNVFIYKQACVQSLFRFYLRDVFMDISYLYGKKFVAAPTPLILQLREEICLQPYKEISWSQARNLCAKVTEAISTCDKIKCIF